MVINPINCSVGGGNSVGFKGVLLGLFILGVLGLLIWLFTRSPKDNTSDPDVDLTFSDGSKLSDLNV